MKGDYTMECTYNVGDKVEVRFKDLTGEETWIPGEVAGYCNDYEVKLEPNIYRFNVVYVVQSRLRRRGASND